MKPAPTAEQLEGLTTYLTTYFTEHLSEEQLATFKTGKFGFYGGVGFKVGQALPELLFYTSEKERVTKFDRLTVLNFGSCS